MTVGKGVHTVRMAKLEYADDAALIDEDAVQATARVTSLAAGSIADAEMIISAKKSKVMHIHKTTRTSATTEADVAKFNLVHKCEWRTCQICNIWVAGCKATRATRQTWIIDWRSLSRRLAH